MFQSIKLFSVLLLLLLSSCTSKDNTNTIRSKKQPAKELFSLIPSSHSKLEFNNLIKESNAFNFMSYSYIYLGGGVALGDINNDGLVDIYFGANQNNNKLYINKGDLVFEDISASSKTSSSSGWTTGVNMIDINNDGWLDIYVCKSGPTNNNLRENKLYINQKDNTFLEEGAKWGLNDAGYSIQSYYFDFDKDGDLDMYVVNHRSDFQNNQKINSEIQRNIQQSTSDQLYRNDGDHFTNISKEAGIQNKAWGLSASIGDFNNDGWPDVYVCNDFLEPDNLYINQKDGTFQDEILSRFRHITFNSMGSDIADINNDGLLDLCALDMTPSDHVRSKENMASMNTKGFNTMVRVGYHHQYMINGLQINQGNGQFSDIGQMAGIAKTDWSWAPLLADFDNDGFNDLYITNGIIKDISNRDFRIMLKDKNQKGESMQLVDLINQMPEKKISNYMFQNGQDLSFKDKTKEWGLDNPSFSNGAAYADLDNDGDLDLVINNAKDNAFLYQNNSIKNNIQIKLKGASKNPFGIGAKVTILVGDKKQTKQLYLSRGFQSSVSSMIHFGIQDSEIVDEISVEWPDGKITRRTKIKANTIANFAYKEAVREPNSNRPNRTLLNRVLPQNSGLAYKHQENQFNDFHKQVLLPHSESKNGPFIAQADVNGDKLIDLFIGGAKGQMAQLYIQNKDNSFRKASHSPWIKDKEFEDLEALFFDFDGDGDLDLYVVSGGTERTAPSPYYQDRLYKNDGKGGFTKTSGVLPKLQISGQSICASDIDKDGDLDLFIGGKIIPNQYPYPPKSTLLINNKGIFSDATASNSDLALAGMISDAVFSDFDGDGDDDLLAVGQWSELMLFENNGGKFTRNNLESLKNTRGLWFSIEAMDIDHDGDEDYFIGNLGLNAKYHASEKKEFHIFCADFDKTGTYDIVLSNKYNGELVPIRGKQCSTDQMPDIKTKFPTYKQFAEAGISDMFTDEQLGEALHFQADMLHNIYLENLGNGQFAIHQLPSQIQVGPVLDFEFIDLDGDQQEEIICIGNMYNSEVETQRYDASYGNILKFDDNNFKAIPPSQTGFSTSGDAKRIIHLKTGQGEDLLIITNNNGPLDVFQKSVNGLQ